MINSGNAEHYIWGTVCDGWHLVKDQEFSVILERMPPGGKEVRHYHQTAKQFFFVLSGVLTLVSGDEATDIEPNSGMLILPGTRHQALNKHHEDTHFLVMSCPPSHGDRFTD